MTLFQQNSKQVFLFPGIGVKPFGGERDFFLKYSPLMEPYLLQGSAMAGVDLRASLVAGDVFSNEQFGREIFAYAFACGTCRVFAEKGVSPRCVVGHSLGMYAALVAAQALSFEDGLLVIDRAHQFGRQFCGTEKFGVAVIIGLNHEEVMSWLGERGYYSIHLANLNSRSSCVYAGYRQEIDKLLQWAEAEGAIKTIRLRIDMPFHHPLFMREAAAALGEFVARLSWRRPSCPIVSSLDQSVVTEPEALQTMTAKNLCSTIDWPATLRVLVQRGVEEVIECGAGLSLTQHSRFIDGAPRHYNLKNLRRRLDY
jgi:[acyl-carrier-protein] S-malonyltransferase